MNKKQIFNISSRRLPLVAGLLAALLLGTGSLKAQNTVAPTEMKYQDISVSVYGPGIASMPFKGSDAQWKDKMGYAMGVGADYTYWFSQHVGITAGLKLTYLSSRQQCSDYTTDFSGPLALTSGGSVLTNPTTSPIVTLDGTAKTVRELRTMSFAEIPLRLALTTSNIYLNLGLSVNVAMTNYVEYFYNDPSYVITGLPTMGISMPNVPVQLPDTRQGITFQNTNAGWPFYVLAAAEVGYKFKLNDDNYLSLGLYGRYAILDNTTKGEYQPFNLSRSRVSMVQPSATGMVEQMGYYEFGLRITYHYGVGAKKAYF